MNRIFESFLNRSPSITSRRRQSRGSLLSDSLQTFENRQLLTGAFLPADPAPAAAVSEVVESQGAAMPKFVSTLKDRPDGDNSLNQATPLGDIGGDPTDGIRVSVLGKVKARTDVSDYYQFTVEETGMYRISLSGLRRDIDMDLLDENGISVASQHQSGIASESLNEILEPGTYFIRASINDKGTSRYQINISSIGNLFSSAFNLGTDFGSVSKSGHIGLSGDVSDIFKVRLEGTSDINISLLPIDPAGNPTPCNMVLANANRNIVGISLNSSNGLITQTGLPPGDYYIVIENVANASSSAEYNLTVTLT